MNGTTVISLGSPSPEALGPENDQSALGLRVRARRADHAERIHFFHKFREQGAFCRNSLFLFMSQKACTSSTLY